MIRVCNASHHHDDNSVGGEMIMLVNKKTEDASPIYWQSGVIRKVWTSPNKISDENSG